MPKIRILIAEDSKIQGLVIRKKLETDFDCQLVTSGAQALKEMNGSSPYHLLLLDLQMPEVDGFGVLKELQKKKMVGKVIVTTSFPRNQVESNVIRLGADYLMNKPLDYELLEVLIEKWQKDFNLPNSQDTLEVHGAIKVPYKQRTNCCFICGFQNVSIYTAVPGGHEEDWEAGFFPVFHKNSGFSEWDFLKTMVMVCPYCLFASNDQADFAETPQSPFPYKEDAKKILARTIAARKKLLSEYIEGEVDFQKANRKQKEVLACLYLAEKCMNGLILGEKLGTHFQLGFYQILIGAIEKSLRAKYFKSAMENFYNQLKHTDQDQELYLKTVYFIVMYHIWEGNSSAARPFVNAVGTKFGETPEEEIPISIKKWLKRIAHVWNNGVDREREREIV